MKGNNGKGPRIEEHTEKCVIPDCEVIIRPGAHSKVCPLCRVTISRWSARRPAEVIERRHTLHKWDQRMRRVLK